jgi:hypothetical protein
MNHRYTFTELNKTLRRKDADEDEVRKFEFAILRNGHRAHICWEHRNGGRYADISVGKVYFAPGDQICFQTSFAEIEGQPQTRKEVLLLIDGVLRNVVEGRNIDCEIRTGVFIAASGEKKMQTIHVLGLPPSSKAVLGKGTITLRLFADIHNWGTKKPCTTSYLLPEASTLSPKKWITGHSVQQTSISEPDMKELIGNLDSNMRYGGEPYYRLEIKYEILQSKKVCLINVLGLTVSVENHAKSMHQAPCLHLTKLQGPFKISISAERSRQIWSRAAAKTSEPSTGVPQSSTTALQPNPLPSDTGTKRPGSGASHEITSTTESVENPAKRVRLAFISQPTNDSTGSQMNSTNIPVLLSNPANTTAGNQLQVPIDNHPEEITATEVDPTGAFEALSGAISSLRELCSKQEQQSNSRLDKMHTLKEEERVLREKIQKQHEQIAKERDELNMIKTMLQNLVDLGN